MRPPSVKRQAPPRGRFFCFFRLAGPSTVDSRDRILPCFPCAGAHRVWLHHPRLEALSPPGWRVQSTVGGILCGLAIMLCPRTVLCIRMAARRHLARERPARGRGSPWFRLSAICAGFGQPGAGPRSVRGACGTWIARHNEPRGGGGGAHSSCHPPSASSLPRVCCRPAPPP